MVHDVLEFPHKVKFSFTPRDAVQSNQGTAPSAEEIQATLVHADQVGWHSQQRAGGTFFDLPVKNGRDEWAFNEKMLSTTTSHTTALFRNDCLLGYTRQPQDVTDATVLEFAKMGLGTITNFHGLNDTRAQASIPLAAQKAYEETGHKIRVQGAICIEDNPNITVESCMKSARELIQSGHEGFYLKNANGKADPDFVFDLVTALKEEFPEQDVHIHTHNTFGLGYAIYMAALEAGADGVDVLPPAMAEGAAQPSATKMLDLIAHHPDPAMRARAPRLDKEAIEADADASYAMRFRHREKEIKYNPELLNAMYWAGAAGGASATLRGLPHLEANIIAATKAKDWDSAQVEIYGMQAQIMKRIGSPTQVTPYAFLTTREAALGVMATRLQGHNDPLHKITGDMADYLAGGLGHVPASADDDLVAMALQKLDLDAQKPFIPADELPLAMESTAEALIKAGVDPTPRNIITSAMLAKPDARDYGLNHVVARESGSLKEIASPKLPEWTRPRQMNGRMLDPCRVFEALGDNQDQRFAKIERLSQAVLETVKTDCFYMTGLKTKSLSRNFNGEPVREGRSDPAYMVERFAEWKKSAALDAETVVAEMIDDLAAGNFHDSELYAATDWLNKIIRESAAFKFKNVEGAEKLIPQIDVTDVYRRRRELGCDPQTNWALGAPAASSSLG